MKHLPVIKFRLIGIALYDSRSAHVPSSPYMLGGVLFRAPVHPVFDSMGRIAICVKHDFYATSFRAGVEK